MTLTFCPSNGTCFSKLSQEKIERHLDFVLLVAVATFLAVALNCGELLVAMPTAASDAAAATTTAASALRGEGGGA